MQKRLLAHPKVTVLWNSEPVEALGDGDLLQSIAVRNTKTGERSELPVAGLFYAIGSSFLSWSRDMRSVTDLTIRRSGHEPATKLVAGQLDLDNDGYLYVKPGTTKTSVEGVYGAGDVADKVRYLFPLVLPLPR